jgi:hypothetical protein
MPFVNAPKQNQAIELFIKNFTTLLEGGSRSGKTLIIIKAIFIRALKYAGTRHLICRFHFSDAKRALWYDSLPRVAKLMGIDGALQWNKQDLFIRFPNGSEVWIGGLDDKERTEKVLGLEYATIYLCEASQISFASYEIVRTRCCPPIGVPGKIFIDYNPPAMTHWGYSIFHLRKLPDGSPVSKNDFAWLKINPKDNPNIPAEYIEKNLETLSLSKRKRFLLGEYGVEEGALWKRPWIKYDDKVKLEDLQRIVVGIDPSGSKGGSEVGIVAAGTDYKNFWILDDYSMHGSPKEWGDEAYTLLEKWKGDCFAAEKNFGGDMVESTLTDMGRKIVKVKLVTASRGKIIRAEPISAMYERGQVFHRIPFVALEDEYCTFKGDPDDPSPNRMDAAVWALTELAGEAELSMADVL